MGSLLASAQAQAHPGDEGSGSVTNLESWWGPKKRVVGAATRVCLMMVVVPSTKVTINSAAAASFASDGNLFSADCWVGRYALRTAKRLANDPFIPESLTGPGRSPILHCIDR
jgi:hypothetical protein